MEALLEQDLETMSLSELLNPTNPMLARAMVPYHLNAMLKCMITALPEGSDLPLAALAEHLAQIEALLVA